MTTQIDELETAESQLCEACGCSAEVGFIIKEGDETAEVSISASNKASLLARLDLYLELAERVNPNYKHQVAELNDDATELHALIQFECSAEKLIFELQSRSINR